MTSTAEQMRRYSGPALFSFGFRPFFLFGAIWAAVAMALWLPFLGGSVVLPTAFGPVDWHAHEMIFGYVPAALAGFLLTAVPNWTGRLPVVGASLGVLFGVWVCGRLAILFSAIIGEIPAAIIDLVFLSLLCAVMAREIISANNTRNFVVLGLVVVLLFANGLFHFEAATSGTTQAASRLGIATTITLIMLIGGRVTPSFTRNWLVKQGAGPLPAPPSRFDIAILVISVVALVFWVVMPDWIGTGAFCLAAAVANFFRLARWCGWRTTAEPLVLVLHLAFAFVPAGFALVAIAIFFPATVPQSGALHAWTAGAIAMMTLAIMTRASLGHTGKDLVSTPAISFIYASAFVGVLARIAGAFDIYRENMLHAASFFWIAAFITFAIVYAPLLLKPRA